MSWVKLFDTDTSAADLARITDAQIAAGLNELGAQLAAMDLTDDDRRAALAQAAPIVAQQTRDALQTAWRRLQADAIPTASRVGRMRMGHRLGPAED